MNLGAENPPAWPKTRDDWSALIRYLKLRPSKGLGQNFLVDPEIVQRIVEVAAVKAGDQIVEIGPGLGMLSATLLGAGGEVIGIELDRVLAQYLREALPSARLQIVEGDALVVDLEPALDPDRPYSVVANLPYSSGTAIL